MMKIGVGGAEPFVLSEKASAKYFSSHRIEYLLTASHDAKSRYGYFERLNQLGYGFRAMDSKSGNPTLSPRFPALDANVTGVTTSAGTAVLDMRAVLSQDSDWWKQDNVWAELGASMEVPTEASRQFYTTLGLESRVSFATEPAEQMKALLGMGWPKEVVKRRCLPRIQTLIALGHPLGALKWATAKGAQGKDFQILVHAKNDIVSHHLLTTGFWEGDHLGAAEAFHLRTQNGKAPSPRRYIDIGANLGYFTLLAASRGYEVTALEAMQKNAAIQNVSLCANPKLEQLVTLRNVGLADKPGKCFIVSDNKNQADGIMRCDIKKREDFKQEGYQIRGEIKLETMNTIVKGDYFMMKIDIEGAEPLALSEKGTSEYFSKHKIQYMLTEAADPKGRVAYFKRLAEIGFSIRSVNYDTGETGEDAMYQTAVIPDASLPGSEKAITSSDAVDYFGVMRAPAEGFPLQNALHYLGPGESKAKA